MSKSESDSDLDFESADEGADDLSDLSDLDVEEILKEDVNSPIKPSSKEEKTETKTKTNKKEAELEQIETEIPAKVRHVEEVVKQQEKSSDSDSVEIQQLLAKLEDVRKNVQELNIIKEAKEVSQKTNASKATSSGWDDSCWDDLDNAESESVANFESVMLPKAVKQLSTSKSVSQVDFKPTQQTSVEKPESTAKKLDDVLEKLASKADQASGGWDWSKMGSNFLSLTAQVLEAVETTLGAPDPAELAAKVVKQQKELIEEKEAGKEEKDEETESEEKKSPSAAKSDWDFEDQDWFSLPNKLTNTVWILIRKSFSSIRFL